MSNPKLKAAIVASGTIKGQFSMRAIQSGKQVPIQLALKDAGFVPGDLVHIQLLEELDDIESLKLRIEELESEVRQLEDIIENARSILNNY